MDHRSGTEGELNMEHVEGAQAVVTGGASGIGKGLATSLLERGVAPDGRTARRDRNRLAVLDAVIELFAEGDLDPDPEAVAAGAACHPDRCTATSRTAMPSCGPPSTGTSRWCGPST